MGAVFDFLPIVLWEKNVFESNKRAANKLREKTNTCIAGKKWKPITLDELLHFIGILMHMVNVQYANRGYRYYWKLQPRLYFLGDMQISRFEQIRQCFHFNSNPHEETTRDSLHKVRPLLNIIKYTIGQYMNVGSDLSLDEMSIQIRSRCAGDLTMFNKDNNCGKFHFRLFAVCCAFTWTCLRLRACTRKKDDVADHPGAKGYGAVPQLEKINEIVVDMLSPYSLTHVVVNMDKFYCSPTVANMLAEHAIWCRGTVVNIHHFPKVVLWGKGKAKCGDFHIAVNTKDGVVAGSWYDEVPVNFITTADPSDGETTVIRKIDGVQKEVKSHIAIKRYNRFMHAVDRNAHFRVAFSLATRRDFKKYYIKLFLSLFDICMTNAMVHYFL
jgi:hypothetical protein